MKIFTPAGKYRVLLPIPGGLRSHRSGNQFMQLWSCAYPRQLKKWLADNPPHPGQRYHIATIQIMEGE